MPFTQDNRLIAVDTPLGKDVLLLSAIQGNEGISTPFSFELDLLSDDVGIKFQDIIGMSATVSIVLADGEKRYFNGLISRFAQGPAGDGGDVRLASYSATMVPWLWLLTRTADSRIFQKLSVPEIVEKIFQDLGFMDFRLDLEGSYDKRDYCVQYRETDFNFVSRLLEEEGIFYFFEHEKEKHTLVMADMPDKHKPCPKQEEAWCELTTGGTKNKDMIEHIEVTQEITVGKYTLNDFNFETPKADLKVEAPSQKSLGPGEREIYDYPGGFGKRDGGERLANIRMEEEEAEITTISGSGRCRAFTSGYKFTLKDFYRDDINNKDYILTSVSHSVSQGYSPGSGDSEMAYSNSFTCIHYDVTFRPPRITPSPVVEGVQTATVVGPLGKEIHTDKYGRVKVQFHWDREGSYDDKSSCWIRVSQVHAGAGFGGVDIPRIDEEVIVDFIEGKPDLPIITGRVYNGKNKPPTGLPSAGMVSGLKSNSTPGGGGSNEITMDDTKGKEGITIHGQHNMDTTIENDATTHIKNNETHTVDVDRKVTVGATQAIDVTGADTETYKATRTIGVTGANKETYSATRTIAVTGVDKETYSAARTIGVTGADAESYSATRKIEVSGNDDLIGASNITIDAAGKLSANGSGDVKITGPKIEIEGGSEIILMVGGSSIKITSAAIEITSAKVANTATGNVEVTGAMIKLN